MQFRVSGLEVGKVRELADHSIEALYQACRSVALPVRLGKRRIRMVWPEASFTDWTWFDQ